MCLWQRRLSYTANHCKKEIRTWSEVMRSGWSWTLSAPYRKHRRYVLELVRISEPIHPNVPPNNFELQANHLDVLLGGAFVSTVMDKNPHKLG